jgi:hypothetical protein
MCLHKEIREFILSITGKKYTCIHIPSRENIVFQSTFKHSYCRNDLKQLDNTDLNELAKTLPTIAKSSKSANSIKKYSFAFNKFKSCCTNLMCVLCLNKFYLNKIPMMGKYYHTLS